MAVTCFSTVVNESITLKVTPFVNKDRLLYNIQQISLVLGHKRATSTNIDKHVIIRLRSDDCCYENRC